MPVEKGATMPTRVHFNGGEKPLVLEEDFEQVYGQLNEHESGLFNGWDGHQIRVTVYRSGVAYIEEIPRGGEGETPYT
jgi:hypothetical protein